MRARAFMCDKRFCGSISVEAAAILPIFLVGFLALISIGMEMSFEMKLSNALYKEGRYLALKCHDKRSIAISEAENDIERLLHEMNVNSSIVEGGLEGIDYSNSKLDDGEYILLCAKYNFVPFGANLFGIASIPMSRQQLFHSWSGYENGFWGQANSEYVYITENSEVYHRNRECSHITLNIEKISSEMLETIRNNGGAKYYSCEICHSKKSDRNIYVTDDGNRFHNTITCSGLKRTVHAVHLESVGDRRPCSRCGR